MAVRRSTHGSLNFKALTEERMRARVFVFKTSESLLMFESCTLRVHGGYEYHSI